MINLLITGRRLVFESPLTQAEITSRLQREIAPAKWQPFESKKEALFEGTFADGRFNMSRMVRGRNSFRTMIDGQVSPTPPGTRIDATLRLHPLVVILTVAMALFWALVAALAIGEYVRTGAVSVATYISLAALGVFLLFALSARAEARRATRMLADLFEVQPSPSAAQRG